MIRQVRPPAPVVLQEHGQRWCDEYTGRRERDQGARFRWPVHGGRTINHDIIDVLRQMTLKHCSYCDGYPIDEMSRETIDHFRPKGRFPKLCFQWENLFLTCDACQSAKLEQFEELLLKPDDEAYVFERFFQYNASSGKLEPRDGASDEDRLRAECTIAICDLNRESRCVSRKRQIRDFERLSVEERVQQKDAFPYRFVLDG